jgi:hypothetical protein
MIQLAVNGTLLELGSTISIPMEEVFTIDEFLSIPGEHSWKFALPKTPTNRRAFGFADVLEIVWDPATSYPCSIYVDGRVFKTGKLFIERVSKSAFDVYYIGTVGLLQDLIKEKKINELNWPTVTGITDMLHYAEDAANLFGVSVDPSPSTYPVAFFPVIAPELKDTNLNTEFINRMKIQVNPLATDNYLGFDDVGVNPLVPFVFVREFWNLLQTEYSIVIEGEIFENPDIKRLVWFNSILLNRQNITTNDYENVFGNSIALANHVPDKEVTWFIAEFAKLFNQMVLFDAALQKLTFLPRKRLFELDRRTISFERVVEYDVLFEKQKTLTLRYAYDEEERVAARNWRGTSLGWRGTLAGVDGPEGSEMVDCSLSTLPMGAHLANSNYYMPFTLAGLNEKAEGKLLIFHGKVQPYDAANQPDLDQRPFASCDGKWVTGATQSLVWQGAPLTLTANWWDDYTLRLYAARTVKLSLLLTMAELLDFEPMHVYAIGHWRCLIKKLEYDLKNKDFLAEAEVLKF